MYTNNTNNATTSADLENRLIKVKNIAELADKKADIAYAEASMASSKVYSSSHYMSTKSEYGLDTLLDKVAELEKKVQLLYDQVDELAKKNIRLTNRLKKMKKRMDSVAATAWSVDSAKHKKREHAERQRKIASDVKKMKKNAKIKEALGATEFIVRDEYGHENVINLGSTGNEWWST